MCKDKKQEKEQERVHASVNIQHEKEEAALQKWINEDAKSLVDKLRQTHPLGFDVNNNSEKIYSLIEEARYCDTQALNVKEILEYTKQCSEVLKKLRAGLIKDHMDANKKMKKQQLVEK